MSEAVRISIIFAVPLLLGSIALIFVTVALNRSTVAVEALHILINSRMDDWKKAEKAISRQQGHEEGVAQEQIDQRSLRDQVIRAGDRHSEL
jgi:hypothetical protein